MEKIRNGFMALLAIAIASAYVSCSNGDSDENESKKLENTSWSSVETLSHNSLSVATDKKNPIRSLSQKWRVCQD
jgi:hypothetical protein